MSLFAHFDVMNWLVFAFVALLIFGMLNGIYRVGHLLSRNGLPVYLWIFNGLVAFIMAMAIAERGL